MSIQFMAEQACLAAIERTEALGCSIVVLDPKTGEILAMAVLPSFDPGEFAASDPTTWSNSTVRSLYEPGSTQKLVTVAAAIEEGAVDFDTEMVVPYSIEVVDQKIEDFGNPREPLVMTVADIVTRSSNVGTIMIQQELGDAALREYLSAFGYGQPTGVDFAGEATGVANVNPGLWLLYCLGCHRLLGVGDPPPDGVGLRHDRQRRRLGSTPSGAVCRSR